MGFQIPSCLLLGGREDYVLAEQQRSISLSAGRFRLQGKAAVLSPVLAGALSAPDDVWWFLKQIETPCLADQKHGGCIWTFRARANR